MNIKIKSKFIKIFILASVFILSIGLVFSLYLVKQNQDVRRSAQNLSPTQSPLLAVVEKPSILPGEFFVINIYDSLDNKIPYSGYLFVKSQTCINNSCSSYTGQWKDFSGKPVYADNGTVSLSVPSDTSPQTLRIRFTTSYPVKKLDWSNEITLTVNSVISDN